MSKSIDLVVSPAVLVTKSIDLVVSPIDLVAAPAVLVSKSIDLVVSPIDLVAAPIDLVAAPAVLVSKAIGYPALRIGSKTGPPPPPRGVFDAHSTVRATPYDFPKTLEPPA